MKLEVLKSKIIEEQLLHYGLYSNKDNQWDTLLVWLEADLNLVVNNRWLILIILLHLWNFSHTYLSSFYPNLIVFSNCIVTTSVITNKLKL